MVSLGLVFSSAPQTLGDREVACPGPVMRSLSGVRITVFLKQLLGRFGRVAHVTVLSMVQIHRISDLSLPYNQIMKHISNYISCILSL